MDKSEDESKTSKIIIKAFFISLLVTALVLTLSYIYKTIFLENDKTVNTTLIFIIILIIIYVILKLIIHYSNKYGKK
jgi:small-conductance mechanosensitive channel